MSAAATLQLACAALARAGLVHAYGHASMLTGEREFLVSPGCPLGLATIDAVAVSIDGPLPDGALGEVRAHQAIYRRRKDVRAICRIMPPSLMALSTQGVTPAARHGIGAYFAPRPPLWDDPRLLRDDRLADALAEALGDAPAIVMRGNGAIVVGDGIEKAVVLAWFLEDAARVEERVRAIGGDEILSAEEINARQVWSGGVVDRMWTYLTTPGRIGAYDGGR